MPELEDIKNKLDNIIAREDIFEAGYQAAILDITQKSIFTILGGI